MRLPSKRRRVRCTPFVPAAGLRSRAFELYSASVFGGAHPGGMTPSRVADRLGVIHAQAAAWYREYLTTRCQCLAIT
jgi:hypothetical protein